MKDKKAYNFWMSVEIKDSDMEEFITDKILWNIGKKSFPIARINKLIAFQCAVDKKGQTPQFFAIQKKVIKELRILYPR